jgi:hypothetical protein
MTHRAESIIAAIAANVGGLATTGANVFRGRAYPLADSELPALRIWQGPDEKLEDLGQTLTDWMLTVYVDVVVKSSSAAVDTLVNQIRAEVTVALMADYRQGLAYVLDTIEADAFEPDISNDAEQPAASMRLTWQIHYRRNRLDPST